MKLSISYRFEINDWIFTNKDNIDCIEITAEHFFYKRNSDKLAALIREWPISIHALSFSLGSNEKFDPIKINELVKLVEIVNPLWVSEHISFSRAYGIELGHLTTIPYTKEYFKIISNNILKLKKYINKPVLLENITEQIQIGNPLDNYWFFNELCDQYNCHLLLDVTNLYINSKNQRFCPYEWVNMINPNFIKQLHVVGYTYEHARYFDTHSSNLSDQIELQDLITYIINYSQPEMITLERDDHFPDNGNLDHELDCLSKLCTYEYH